MQFPPRAKPTAKAAPPSEPPTPRSRSASRKRSLRGRSQSGKSNRQPCKNFLKGTCTYLVTVGILPNVNSISLNRGVNSAQSAHFPRWRVEEQTNKRPKKGDDKSAVAFVKDVRQLGCVFFLDTESPEFALRQANMRENKGPSLNKIQVKSSHQRSPYTVKFEDRSQEGDRKTRAMPPRRRAETCQEYL